MAKTRRVIRKVDPAELHSFDEQLWPVNVALVVMAGFVTGVIIALSSFSDPRVFYNGYVHLATLAITVGLLIWLASKLDNRRVRRGLQLAAVLSLLIHMVLMVVLYNQRLQYLAREDEATDDASLLDEELVALPDYHMQAPEDQEPETFERPVDVETPDEATAEVARADAKPVETMQDNQKTPLPGETPAVEPNSVKMAERSQTVPRRAEQPSKLSRQTNPVTPSPTEVVNVPQHEAQSPLATKMEASIQPVERRSAAAAQTKSATSEPAVAPQQQPTQVARREQSSSTPTPQTSSPTLTRQVRQPVNTPRSAIDSPQPEAAGPNADPQTLQPSAVAARRQAVGPEATMKPSAEPQPQAATSVAQANPARNNSAAASSPAPKSTTPPASLAKSATQTPNAAASAQTVDGPAAASSEPTANPVAPASTQVARADAGSPAANVARADMSGAEATIAVATPGAGEVGGSALARAVSADQPSVNPFSAPSARPARAATTAPAAESPTNIDSPSLAQGEGTPGSEAGEGGLRTGSLAVGKASSGAVGAREPGSIGQGADPGTAGSPQPGPVAAVAANRGGSGQGGAPGPVVGTSAPAAIAKSATGGAGGGRGEVMSGADVPTTNLPAQETVSGGGGAGPGGLRASSGSALARGTTSGPTPGGSGAQPGSGAAVNQGPAQVVAQLGSGRAAGGDGGGPVARINTKGSPLARSNTGGGGVGAIASAQIAAVPAAPAGDGGGAPTGRGAAQGTNIDASASAGAGARAAQSGGLPNQLAMAAGPGGGSGGGTSGSIAGGTIARSAAGTGGGGTPGPAASGGAGKIARATGRGVAADGQAEMVELPSGSGTPTPSGAGGGAGASGGGAPQVAADAPMRGSAGLPGQTTGPTGAAAGEIPVVSNVHGGVGAGLSPRRGEAASENGPSVAAITGSGPLRKTVVAGVANGTAEMIDAPAEEGQPSGGTGTAAIVAAAGSTGAPSRAAGSLPVQVAALDGPGGLGAELAPEVGSMSRRSQRDSEIVHAGNARFLNRKVGGPLAIDGRAREPAEAFSNRGGKRLTKGSGPGMPTERTEAAVEAGLDFLARHQSSDGSWSLNNFGAGRAGYENESAEIQSDAAATGLALLTYLGAGYDHYDDQYKHVIRAGLEYLISHQKANGDLYVPHDAESNKSAWLYTHGIASIALCEAYGMTGDENLKGPAQKAIDFVVATQSPKLGGWRYTPQFQSDTSVSGWQLMALKSGELAGLKVPPETYTRVKMWLDSAKAGADGAQFVYNPGAPNTPSQRHGRSASTSMTAVGLLMRLYTGSNRNDPRMVKGADHLLAHLPSLGTAAQPARDTYYWYYATQVMFHMKGKHWQQWHEHLHPMLVERQVQTGPMAGSWDPKGAVPDRWAGAGGRIYVTTLNLLSLEVAYRHLPIYESTAK